MRIMAGEAKLLPPSGAAVGADKSKARPELPLPLLTADRLDDEDSEDCMVDVGGEEREKERVWMHVYALTRTDTLHSEFNF